MMFNWFFKNEFNCKIEWSMVHGYIILNVLPNNNNITKKKEVEVYIEKKKKEK